MALLRSLVAGLALVLVAGGAELVLAQELAVSGTVTAPDGTPVATATVAVKGANRMCVTRPDGTFHIAARNAADTLVFSKFQYASVEMPLTASDGALEAPRITLQVTLMPESNPRSSAAPVQIRENPQSPPLYLIDGVPSDRSSFDSLDPGRIRTIYLVRDIEVLARLGRQGTNGVIAVELKPDC